MATESAGIDLPAAVTLLGAAVVDVPIFRRAGLGSVLGYLAAGLAMDRPGAADRRPEPVPLFPISDRDWPGPRLPAPLTSFVGREREIAFHAHRERVIRERE